MRNLLVNNNVINLDVRFNNLCIQLFNYVTKNDQLLAHFSVFLIKTYQVQIHLPNNIIIYIKNTTHPCGVWSLWTQMLNMYNFTNQCKQRRTCNRTKVFECKLDF